MKMKPLPDRRFLLSILRYEPDTGKLYWRERPRDMFPTDGSWKTWNTRYAHSEAFTSRTSYGHGYSNIGRSHRFLAHRVIWKMETGEEPGEIDHENGDPSDNRWINLREATHAENAMNRRMPARNKSGVHGVSWHRHAKKWCAEIKVAGQRRQLGYFTELEEARKAREAAERELGFHVNHGRA